MSTEIMSAAEIRQEAQKKARDLGVVQGRIAAIFEQYPKGPNGYEFPPQAAKNLRESEEHARKLSLELETLHQDHVKASNEEALAKLTDEAFSTPVRFSGAPSEAAEAGVKGRVPADLTQAFVESRGYKAWQRGFQNQHASFELENTSWRDVALKATLTTSTGPFTGYDRSPSLVPLGQQMLTVADLFSNATTNSPVVRYIQEDTFTNAATSVTEGNAKPEASWDLSEVDATVRKIAVIAKVTDEAFADFGQLRSYINDRLPFMVKQREELLLLSGDGTPPNITGILTTSGILTQARGSDTNIDAIYKAMTKVRSEGFWEPDGVVIDPTNWTPIRLAKETTGGYIYGDPWAPGPETIFGKRVVVTANMTDNTALVGAFRIGGTVYFREGLRVEATNSNEDDFEKNLITLRAEERLALAVFRPTAFCTVTSLTT